MKIKLNTYHHSDNGISLQVVPETDEEESLLRGIWKHGKLDVGHPCAERGSTGFYVKWQNKDPAPEKPTFPPTRLIGEDGKVKHAVSEV